MPRVGIVIAGDPRSAVKAFRTTRSEAALLDRQLARTGRGVDRFGRGVVAGSGVLGGLGRSVAFASSTFLGGAGLVYAFRKVTTEARNAQAIQVRTAQAVRRAGLEWRDYRKEILRTSQVQSRKSSFDDEKLLDQLGQFITRTKDVRKAQELLNITTDVARGRNMSLEASGRLVMKASIGQAGALRRLGIAVKQGATAETILAALRRRYAGQAERYSRTSAGAQDRFNKTLQDSEEIIGRALLPQIDKLVRRATEWLDTQNRSGQLQRTVNANLKDASQILGGVADALKIIKTGTEPVVDAVGGIGNAVTALTLLWAGMKVKAIVGFGATATASRMTARSVVADAAMMETALDAATRPRVIPITVAGPGGMIPGIPGKIGKYGTGKTPKAPNRAPVPKATTSGFLGTLKRWGGAAAAGVGAAVIGSRGALAYGYALPTATIIAILMSAGAGSRMGDRSGKYPRVYRAVAMAANGTATPQQLAALQVLGQYSLENAPDKLMRQAEQQLRRYERYQKQVGVGHPPRGGKPKPGVKPGGGTAPLGGGPPRRTLRDIQTDVYRAQAAGNEGLELQFLRELKAAYQRARQSLERRGELSKKEKDQYDNILRQIASTNAQIDAITEKGVKEVASSKKKANDAEKKAAAEQKAAADKLREQWQASRQQAAQAFGPLFGGPTLGSGLGDFFREFGTMGAKLDPTLILQDIKQQNAQSAALLKNLQTVAKRGAPVGLMNELRAMGPEGAAFAASLANAPQDIFDAIVAAFKQRETQLKQATVFIQARNVVVKTAAPTSDRERAGRMAGGGMVPGSGIGDTVPAMLTPGEMVLNRMQQGGLARVLGMGGASPQHLFGAIQRMAGGGVLDGRPWFSRRGPREWGLSIYGPDPRVPMRRDIHGFLESWKGHGLSPAQAIGGERWWHDNWKGIAKGYKLGGVVSRFVDWTKQNKPEVNVLRKVGNWLGWPGRTRGGRYANAQAQMFGESIIPTPAGIKAMGLLGRDIGLGYLAPPIFGLQDPRARERARLQMTLMARSMITALKDPVGNAGLLAGMFVPLPGPGKLTGPTKALEKFKARLVREGAAYDVPTNPANLRLSRTELPKGAAAFNRRAGMVAARQIWAMATEGGKRKGVLPPGVNSPRDIVELMHDMWNSAQAGKVGRFWYQRSGADILRYTHGNKAEAKKLALLAALYSPRVSVEESIKRAARAWQEYKDTGGRSVPTKGVFDYQPGQAMKILSGEMTALNGRKVNNFFLDLMTGIDGRYAKRHRRPGGSTVDVWMQKAFGYKPKKDPKTGKWGIAAPNDPQYDFMESVVASIAGQLGWTPNQAQAAIWSTTKARFEKRPVGRAALNLGDYFSRQATQINYEAAWGALGKKIRDQLGDDAARRYAAEKFALLGGSKGQNVILEALGLLGKRGGPQQGVWGIDVNPGFHDLVLAPRFPENMKRFRMFPRFEQDVREASAAIGYVLRQQGVGTLTEFPMQTAAGTLNANVKAGANAAWLARKFTDSELAAVSQKLGTRMLMIPRRGGWIIKPASNSQKARRIMDTIGSRVHGLDLEPANAPSGYVDASEYMTLIDRANKKHPGFLELVRELRGRSEAIDQKWMDTIASKMLHAAGGALVPGRGNRDTVPAMLTPGELVLNRKQQGGLARALGLGRASGQKLFSEIQGFAGGGVLTGRQRQATSFLPGSSSGMQPAPTFQQHNTITVPPQFSDTEWAIERGLQRATWRLRKGI